MTMIIESDDLPFDSIQFLEKSKHVDIWGHKMPHWFQAHKTMFVTFRLADSLPHHIIEEYLADRAMMREESKAIGNKPRKYYDEKMEHKMESWLNNGHGSCVLGNENVRQIVVGALRHYNYREYLLHSFIVMPNHLHILLSPLTDKPINNIIGRIKGFTSFEIKKMLGIDNEIWQQGMFDRIVRSDDEFKKYVDYIRNNPQNIPSDRFTLYIQRGLMEL